ncbi:helicase-related protein [Fructilactobacillus frigidiflavus]|uniref:helicase-related protein n=1 Tax=Fructilactobacillus frigidiflavus TaxID=3242688 RepID=UPI003756784F
MLTKKYQGKKCWDTVYSADEKRMEKVQAMRDEKLLFLITTTILERGVTFPGIDVIIFGGDERVFSVASLVQIAGRVGRKASRPTGDVDCYIGNYANNVAEARNQIKEMNWRGQALG